MLKVEKHLERKVADTVIWSMDEILRDGMAAPKYCFHLRKKKEITQTCFMFSDHRTKCNRLIVKQAKFSLN